MKIVFVRFLYALIRYTVAINNLGFTNTIYIIYKKIFISSNEQITDITSTGSTLKENNLRIINDGVMLKSSACIFFSKKTIQNKLLNIF